MISKIKNLILFLSAIIIVIVAAEITLNIIGKASLSRMNPGANLSTNAGTLHWRPDPVLHHVLVPGAKFYRTSPNKKEFITYVEYNSKGLNDYEYDYEKGEDTVLSPFRVNQSRDTPP